MLPEEGTLTEKISIGQIMVLNPCKKQGRVREVIAEMSKLGHLVLVSTQGAKGNYGILPYADNINQRSKLAVGLNFFSVGSLHQCCSSLLIRPTYLH